MLTEQRSPDLEELAAYLDGQLSRERKAQVEERLLHDEDFYEIFLETVHFQQEHGQQAHDGRTETVETTVVWWRSSRIVAPLAAAAMLLLVIGLPRLTHRFSAGEWVAQLDAPAVVAREGWAEPGWTVLRSGNVAQGRYQPEELAFRLGLRAVDLRVALAAEDRIAAARLAAMLEELAGASDLFVTASVYGDVLEQIDDDAGFDDLMKLAATAGEFLEESFEDGSPEARRLALGGWTEAGRLAALTGNAEVLAGVVLNDEDARSNEKIAQQVATLESITQRPDPGEKGFDEAAIAFSDIARALAGR